MEQYGVVLISLAAFVGGLLYWLMGWLKSGEDFLAKKFALSAVLALFAGVAYGLGYGLSSEPIAAQDVLIALLAGAGWDAAAYAGVKAITPSASE